MTTKLLDKASASRAIAHRARNLADGIRMADQVPLLRLAEKLEERATEMERRFECSRA